MKISHHKLIINKKVYRDIQNSVSSTHKKLWKSTKASYFEWAYVKVKNPVLFSVNELVSKNVERIIFDEIYHSNAQK